MAIDTVVLRDMMVNVGLASTSRDDFFVLREDHFTSVFELKGLLTGDFGHVVETDGVSACFHFRKPELWPDLTRPRKKRPDALHRSITIDPGHTNLIYRVERLADGAFNTCHMARPGYYHDTGMVDTEKQARKWEDDIVTE